MENIVTVTNLSKTYGTGETAVYALKNVNIAFEKNKFTAIIGTSGSGKSTFLNLLGGLDTANSGEILYGETNLLKLSDDKLSEFRRKNIGFVFQFFNLIPELTARENILMPIKIDNQKTDTEYFEQIVETLGIKDRLGHYPSQLSGGQQQRTAIARALINKPSLILCDEPTGNLDSKSGDDVLMLLKTLKEKLSQTIIMVTHDIHIASKADRIVQIEDGKIVEE